MLTKFLKPEARQSKVDTREVANLWDILKAKYDFLEFSQTSLKLVHDIDLKYILEIIINQAQRNVEELETIMKKYQINGPDQNRLASDWASNAEITRDEFIATNLLIHLQEHIESTLRSSRTSITNDNIRKMFMDMSIQGLKNSETLFKYLKLKGWIESPPLYLSSPPEMKEKICSATASQLWDHVTFRYDNLRKTRYFLAVANDQEFKFIISKGIDRLMGQVNILEKECQNFGISLPKRPPEVIVAPAGTEMIKDDQLYRDILQGLQMASSIHADAIKKCITNDRVRSIFTDMLLQEIKFYDKFVKYGKLKAWLNNVPLYRSM